MGTRADFGTTRQLRSGRWQARYVGPDGVRRTAPHTFETRREAREWLDDTGGEVRRGVWRRPELGRQRLDDYAVGWLVARDDLKPRTRELYAGLLDRHILPTLGVLELDAVSPTAVRDWHTALGQSTGPTARAQAYRLLSTIMRQAVRDGAIVVSPCVLPRAGAVDHAERVPATLGEVAAIAGTVPARYRMLVELGAWSGLRFGELTALRRGDVDLEAGTVRVSRAIHRVDGEWIETSPKSAAGRRTVHLPPHLLPGLEAHLAEHVGRGADARAFCTSTGRPLPRSQWAATFRRAADKVGRDDLRFHDLRHTGATLAAQAGATTKELMARLGHGSARAAMIYQHAASERDAAIAAALSEAAAAVSEAAGGTVIPLRRQA